MTEEKTMRLSQVARKLNVGRTTIIEFLSNKGYKVDRNPNSKIDAEQYDALAKEFAESALEKEEASGLTIGTKAPEDLIIKEQKNKNEEEEEIKIKDLSSGSKPLETSEASNKVETDSPKLVGIKVVGKIDLDQEKKKKEELQKKEELPKREEPKIKERQAEEKPVEPVTKPEDVIEESKDDKKPQAVEVTKKEAEPEKKTKEHKVAQQLDKTKEVKAKEKASSEQSKKSEETNQKPEPEKVQKQEQPEVQSDGIIEAKADSLKGLTVLGKIDLQTRKKPDKDKGKEQREAKKESSKAAGNQKQPLPVASSDQKKERKKRPRKRITSQQSSGAKGGQTTRPPKRDAKRTQKPKEELSDKEIQNKIKNTLAKLSSGSKSSSNRSKYRKEKRSQIAEAHEEEVNQQKKDARILKVTEFISANDLASLMNVSVNEVISTCMNLGMFISINQRLDAESITIIADEFGYNVDFTNTEEEIDVEEVQEEEENLQERAPIVTIMGHVDHGKTSLLDYIRKAKVAASEAGGITQHIGAYDVVADDGRRVAFLDTPGHEAFTAMRARGAKITDVVVVVVAADDSVMPQTKEAINHSQVAGVPIVIAINKVDKANANSDKIKEELSGINILVEDWGGKFQCQEVSAKTGLGVDELLEKVLLEAELLELKANAKKNAVGTVIEASLDKGRGYVATIMVQEGTLKVGDVILAGSHFGKVKAMFDHRGKKIKNAGPSTPVLMLGLDGAPQAGDKFNVMDTDREAREIANKREQILREQSIRTKKHITLDEIGRRLAIGTFKELNVIVRGDVDGSVEALSDSLLKLSTDEIVINIIHKGVGQISESDVLLATASDAIIVGFQVRPSSSARKIAENEEIEIRLYSVIYDAINEIKDAMEGMLEPTEEEVITGNIEVREVFKISKVGTVAGCYVTDGVVKRQNKIRLIRDGIVTYTGEINALKRFKDDVNEVKAGYECGLSIKNYNDIKVGDIIEGFTTKEVKRTLQ
ncbi:MAG TPA: translation initiation factor IF-2 [Cyclobacteriaceae bacterium]